MRRRDFFALLGGVAASWPGSARPQQADRIRRIGMLIPNGESDPEGQTRIAALRQGLEVSGVRSVR